MSDQKPNAQGIDLFSKFMNGFVSLSETDWQSFIALFSEVRLKKGDFFAHEGRLETKFAFVLGGVFRSFYIHSSAKEYNKGLFETGEFIGAYTSLITQKKTSYSFRPLPMLLF